MQNVPPAAVGEPRPPKHSPHCEFLATRLAPRIVGKNIMIKSCSFFSRNFLLRNNST